MSLSYGSHPDQVVDLSFPEDVAGPVPLVVFWHGGFWRAEHDRRHVEPLVADLVRRGFAVANVEYRRVGAGGGWPTTLEDAALVTEVLPELVERERPGLVDHARTVYAGHSAGGHLAVWAALRHKAPGWEPRVVGGPSVAGVLALSPVLDLVEADRLAAGRGAVHDFFRAGPGEAPERFAVADPTLLGAGEAPLVVVHGDADSVLPVEMSRRYVAEFGGSLLEHPGTGHFEVIDPAADVWPSIVEALVRLADKGADPVALRDAGDCRWRPVEFEHDLGCGVGAE